MKQVVIWAAWAAVLILGSCRQQAGVQEALADEAYRQEIFEAIAGNPDYMTGFMKGMEASDRAMGMMMDNQQMMGAMMRRSDMSGMMRDSVWSQNMMGQMMQNPAMMGRMMQMMHDRGMLDAGCMQAAMQHMQGPSSNRD